MKKTFTLITILISFSLVGLIFIQVSWLKNMVKVREEAIKEKVDRAVRTVGEELVKYKEIYLNNQINSLASPFQEDQSIEILRPLTIGSRFTTAELSDKIRNAFNKVELFHMRFEFLLTAGSLRSNTPDQMERISKNYEDEREDTINNFYKNISLIVPSGSDSENLSKDENLFVLAVDYKQFAVKSLRMPIAIAILFTIIIITAFYLTVQTMLRQKKLGEIKNDFINNMTHEFKTPIATISLAVDAMKNEKVLQDREKITYFSGIIKEENQRMNRQVETILKASQLERREVDLNLQPLHAHKVITDVVDNFILQLEGKQAKAEVVLQAEHDLIDADEVHFSNLVNNLVDNAIKYSKENTPLQLKVSTGSDEKKFYLKVEDNGIGMSKETVKRVFERFYRAHTGNIHNVKGFGLGLSYVKTMVEAHHGDIKAESTLGRGSCFTVEFPLKRV